MKLRALLILAILAGLGSAGVAYYQFTVQIPALIQQRDAEQKAKADEVAAHNLVKNELKVVAADLDGRRQELASAKSELQKELARADVQEKHADDLAGKIAKADAELQNTRKVLTAYQATGLTPDEVVKLPSNVKAAQQKVVVLVADRDKWHREYLAVRERFDDLFPIPYCPGPLLPSDLKGTVVVVDPKWDFVVLNIGAKQGAMEDCEMLISRKAKLVSKVVITKVEQDRSVARVVAGWKLGEIFEGDVVTPARVPREFAYLESY